MAEPRIFENCVFKCPVEANESEFNSCKFEVRGSSKKDPVSIGLTIREGVPEGSVKVRNCEFANMGYSAIAIRSGSHVEIDTCKFDCTDVYNPIEGSVSMQNAAVADVVIKNNILSGVCGNNYINFYNMADGGHVEIRGNRITGMGPSAEMLRLSNPANVTATFDVIDNSYAFGSPEVDEWAAFMLCQDYTKGGVQDFSKYTINIENLTCNGTPVEDGQPVVGKLCIVYDDEKGVIEDNNPVINF